MKEEIFETVLNEILEELKKANEETKELQRTVAALAEKVNGFDQRLNEQVVAPPADTMAIQQLTTEGLVKIENAIAANRLGTDLTVADGFQKVSAIVEAQPKAIVRQWRLVFFPEHDHNGTYRFFISRALLCLILLALIGILFRLCTQWFNNIHLERMAHPISLQEPRQETLANETKQSGNAQRKSSNAAPSSPRKSARPITPSKPSDQESPPAPNPRPQEISHIPDSSGPP